MPKAQAQAPVAEEVKEVDLTTYATKGPTSLQRRFAEWIPDATGYNPNAAKTKMEAFAEGVRLATAMRMIFQASPENRAATEAERAERLREAGEVPVTPSTAPKKSAGKKAVAAAEEEAAQAPAPRRRKATAAKAAPVEEPEEEAVTEPVAKPRKAARRPLQRQAAPVDDAPF